MATSHAQGLALGASTASSPPATKPSVASSHSAAPLAPAPAATAIRPDPGLRRGVWEAPPWAFYVGAAVVVVFAAIYAARRLGLLKLRRPRA